MSDRAARFEQEHTLEGDPTDPQDVHAEDAYQEQDDGTVLIDPSRVVLVQQMLSSTIQNPESGQFGIAFQLKGHVRDSPVSITHVVSAEGAARMVAQLIELAISTDEDTALAFQAVMSEEMRFQAMNHEVFARERQHGDRD